MVALIDLTGKRFGKLIVLERVASSSSKQTRWLCECDCSKRVVVQSGNLRTGHTKSCGCIVVETCRRVGKMHTHGLSRHPLYRTWRSMLVRCYSKTCKRYKDYGGRGITVCDEWKKDFMPFYRFAISSGYKKGLSLDRIDNDKGYSPDNCKWSTAKEQANNRRPPPATYITFDTHRKMWTARVKRTFVGRYDSKEDAIIARDNFIRENGIKVNLIETF